MGPLTSVVDGILQDLKTGIKEKRGDLQTLWPQIAGAVFSAHTKAHLQPGGILFVWVDNSTLAYELSQRYQGTLLKRARTLLGDNEVKKIVFRVGQIR